MTLSSEKWLTLDTETSTFQKGNPFAKCNQLVNVGVKTVDTSYIAYSDEKLFKETIQDF